MGTNMILAKVGNVNPDKCHILISGYNHEVILAKVGNVNPDKCHILISGYNHEVILAKVGNVNPDKCHILISGYKHEIILAKVGNVNPDKCHILISGYKHEVILAKVGNVNVIESHKVTLLGIEIDSDLKFHNHIRMICSKAAKKIKCLIQAISCTTFSEKKISDESLHYVAILILPISLDVLQ